VCHDSAEIAFSGHQNAENELIQRYVPLNRGYQVSEKSHFQVSNKENLLKLREVPFNSGLHDSAKFAFSCPQNAVNVLTRKYVPLNLLFNDSAEISFSAAQVQKMSSHESRYP